MPTAASRGREDGSRSEVAAGRRGPEGGGSREEREGGAGAAAGEGDRWERRDRGTRSQSAAAVGCRAGRLSQLPASRVRSPARSRRPARHLACPPGPAHRAHLGHGCLPLGPALGHRLMPRGAGHGRPGEIAPRRGPPSGQVRANPRRGKRRRRLTPRALRMRVRPCRAPCRTGGVRAPRGARAQRWKA
jgi:hypothetical protein